MTSLRECLSIQSVSGDEFRMFRYIVTEAKKIPDVTISQDYIGNLYIWKGTADSYPCAVAHMDTVHDIIEKFHVQELNGVMYAMDGKTFKQCGIGGDDKVGVYIALKLLAKFPVFKCAFFVSEETGCVGSAAADLSFFKDCRFILQADRRGNKDLITKAGGYDLCSADFISDILPFAKKRGFKQETGLMTDVMELTARKVGVSCINASCGYYNPHSSTEVVVVRDVINTLNLFEDICKLNTVYRHTAKEKYYDSGLGYGYQNKWSDWYKPVNTKSHKKDQGCAWCCKVGTKLTYSTVYSDWLCASCEIEVEQWANGG